MHNKYNCINFKKKRSRETKGKETDKTSTYHIYHWDNIYIVGGEVKKERKCCYARLHGEIEREGERETGRGNGT